LDFSSSVFPFQRFRPSATAALSLSDILPTV
jgi:hypothetical protein